MAGRRRAPRLSLLAFALVFAIAGAVPARASVIITAQGVGVPDLDLSAVPRVSLGLTNQGVTGAVCSSGFLSFLNMLNVGSSTFVLQSGTDFRCQDVDGAVPISGGSLLASALDRSVTGVIGDEGIIGEILPNGHGVLALDVFEAGSQFGGGVGFTALIEPRGNTTPFTQSDLGGTWRIKTLSGEQGLGGGTEVRFGSITFGAAGNVLGGVLSVFPFGGDESIVGGNVTMVSGNRYVGVVTTFDGQTRRDVEVQALMAGDKNFIAGVSARLGDVTPTQGMFFMQREPAGIAYTMTDLAGVWNVFSLQALTNSSASSDVFLGTLTFDASGHVTASTLTSPSRPLDGVANSLFTVSAQGFIAGGIDFDDETSLRATATMFKEKNHIIGVNAFVDGEAVTVGLFTMFKHGPPPAASVVQFSAGNYSVTEGATATITVTRTGATTTTVTVDFFASDPVNGMQASGTVTIPAGFTSMTFQVPTFDNSAVDPDHVVALSLGNPTNGATIGARGTANLIVMNNDSSFAFSQPSYTVKENAGKATITIMRSGALAFPASVLFRAFPGTASAGKDFTPVSRNISFAKNVTTATVDVPILNNTALDGERTVLMQLGSAPVGAPRPAPVALVAVDAVVPTATLTITDDDTPGVVRLSSPVYNGLEGTSVLVTILRAPKVAGQPLGGNVSVDYTTFSNGSAIGSIDGVGADYTITSGTVTFTGAETSKTVSIPLTKDNIAEGPEFFFFGLSNPTNDATLGSPSTARINISDIDRGGLVTLSASSYSVIEGAGNISIIVKRIGGSAANASVLLTTSDGTAAAGSDYVAVSQRVVFGLNETMKVVVIPIIQDNLFEGTETFKVTLSDAQGGASIGAPAMATVMIVDDESTIQFARPSFEAREGTAGIIVVTRSGALGTRATVTYNISSVTAFPGKDFMAPASGLSGMLTFGPGITQQSLVIPTISNTVVDGNRNAIITLGSPTGGAQLGPNSTATFTVVDDDQPGRFLVGNRTYAVREGGSVLVDIVRLPAVGNNRPLAGNISVSYATSDGNASAPTDFVPVSGTFVFGPFETKKQVMIQTKGNTIVDPNKNFFFALSAPTGGATLDPQSLATIVFQDDDSAGVVFLGRSSYTVSEGAGNVSITVMRTGGTANASVRFRTVAGTASDGGDRAALGPSPTLAGGGLFDYGFVSTTLEFGAGEMSKTVVIPIIQDNVAEGDELFTVMLSNPQGGLKLGNPVSAPVTIKDDEVVIQFSGKYKNNQPEVIRTGPLTDSVSVDYVAASGTAILNEDFRLPPGTLVFPPGVSSRMIPISVIQDNIAEGPETFTITLLNPSAPAQLGPNSQQIFVLNDDDFGGTVSFANTSSTVALGQAKPMVVKRLGGLGTVMTVGWSAIGGSAVPDVDFSPSSGEVTFLANQATQTVIVNIAGDLSAAGKTIVFGLTVPGGGAAKLGAGNTSTLTILGGGGLELVSQATNGTRGNGDSVRPAVSSDGRYVALISGANNLAPGAGEGAGVYVRDRQSGTTELVSAGLEGSENGDASAVAISGDGRFVAYVSTSSNLVGNDGNEVADVFLRDRVQRTTQRVSVPVTGGEADGASVDVAISGDGNVIAFSSMATNLAPGAGNTSNLYLFSRQTGTIVFIASGRSPALSVDGDFVAFLAEDLLAPGTQAYVFERSTGRVDLVSESDGQGADGTFIGPPAITADGRLVAFASDATNIAFPSGGSQIFVADRNTGAINVVSRRVDDGPVGNGPSGSPSFSADGRFVAFVSAATNLVGGDTNDESDVFVHDRMTGDIRRINVLSTGTQANGSTDTVALSGSGTFAAFATSATSLSGGDFNEAFDVLGVPLTIEPLP